MLFLLADGADVDAVDKDRVIGIYMKHLKVGVFKNP